jgi:hypothetical protein
MNEQIITTLLYGSLVLMFIFLYFNTFEKEVELSEAYYGHVRALQRVNEVLNAGESFEDYCSFVQNNPDSKARVTKLNESCRTQVSDYSFIVSLPVLDNNEVVWVSSYA